MLLPKLLSGEVFANKVLYDASGSGNLECIELLLQNGANLNVASPASCPSTELFVRKLLDYVGQHLSCHQANLEKTPEWEEISDKLSRPTSLQHFSRLLIRGHMILGMLNDPESAFHYPPRLKSYLTYRENDL
ncbi:hypothetical protein KUCAC02_006324 [Chaenocephalus aceratus]|uniref:Uncharacterized protein n=1 Tax=Chaenocephalus aceratus TaxID=36190 RepID=A0ACB9VS31_CHAAC|nr:hypothetical protein KUCAC02_006324 [Chaenocephalus aceratus]